MAIDETFHLFTLFALEMTLCTGAKHVEDVVGEHRWHLRIVVAHGG